MVFLSDSKGAINLVDLVEFVFPFFPRDGLEREIGKDQASLAAKYPTENALRASMPDCESGSLRDSILSKRASLQNYRKACLPVRCDVGVPPSRK